MSRNRKNHRNHQARRNQRRQRQAALRQSALAEFPAIVETLAPDIADDNETVSFKSFKTATQYYNRAVLDHLLQYQLIYDEHYDEALMLICDGFGLTKANGKHLLTTAHILTILPDIRARIYDAGTADLERLIIIGKQLAGLNDDQIMEVEPAIYNLFTSDEETYEWVKTTIIRAALKVARLDVDEEARAAEEARVAAREEKKQQQQSRLVHHELNDGRTEIIIRIDKENSPQFNQQVAEAAQTAGKEVADYLYDYVHAVVDPDVTLLAVADDKGNLVVEGCQPMVVKNVIDLQNAVREARRYRLSKLRGLITTPEAPEPGPADPDSSGHAAA